MNSDLDQLKELIFSIENSEKVPEVISWMEEISKKEFGLIDSLILTFMDNSKKNISFSNSILRSLKFVFFI